MPEKDERLYGFVVPLTEEQKREYDRKRRSAGLTSQGCMRELILSYIQAEGVKQ